MCLSIHLLLVSILSSVRCVSADGGDDFANNLFSDLGPLLALFGERVTMQFMSQAIGWADNIILAMAPLGIITAIVGAIRVGGPSWLKAVIGRARENLAVAEAELLSSTSQEVCELWNGQQIVRCMGSPSVVEFICLLPTKGEKIAEIEVESRRKALNDSDEHLRPIRLSIIGDYHRRRERQQSSEASPQNVGVNMKRNISLDASSNPKNVVIKRNDSLDAPNISLNTHRQRGRGELRVFAFIGTVLQMGVLLYSGFATYYPALRFLKDGNAIASYAYPCTATGTLVLIVGMMLCAHVVESRTAEEHFQAKPGINKRIRMVWLQQSKTVGDQVFGSFAIYGNDDQTFVTTSRRSQKEDGENGNPNRVATLDPASQTTDSRVKRRDTSLTLQVKAVLGTMTTLAGFVLQFVGLRGLHWSASIAQLGAVLMMVCLKAWVRRGLATPPKAISLPSGYELDWFAKTLGNVNAAPWNCEPNSRVNSVTRFGRRLKKLAGKHGMNPAPEGSGKEFASSWKVANSGDTHFGREKRSRNQGEKQKKTQGNDESKNQGENQSDELVRELCLNNAEAAEPISDAQRVLKIRKDLGHLAKWRGPASTEAVSLARAIEITMDALIGPAPMVSTSSDTFYWSLDAVHGGEDNNPINFEIWRQPDGKWKAFANEYDAALSLWLSSAHDEKKRAIMLSENSRTKPVNHLHHSERSVKGSLLHLISQRFCGDNKGTAARSSEDAKKIVPRVEDGKRTEHLINKEDDGRLRKEESKGEQGLRLLGLHTPALRRELQWWLPKDLIQIFEVQQSNSGTLLVESQRVLGFHQQNWSRQQSQSSGENDPESITRFARTELSDKSTDQDEGDTTEDDDEVTSNDDDYESTEDEDDLIDGEGEPIKGEEEPKESGKRPEGDPSESTNSGGGTTYLAAESYASLPSLFAQHMFSAFMHAVASTNERSELFQSVAQVQPNNAIESGTWKSFTLHNATLSSMIREIESTGLGSQEDIYACVIPPLSQKQKLPRADDAIIQLAREQAKQYERLRHWEAATDVYLWIFQKANTFGEQKTVAKATAILMEYLRLVSVTINLREADDIFDIKTLKEIKITVEKTLKRSADPQILFKLMTLYTDQDRVWKGDVVSEENTQLSHEENDKYPEAFNFTIMHREAKGTHPYSIYQAERYLNAKDIFHWTPLHYAVRTCNPVAGACLLGMKAHVDACDLMGWTPLHYLCQLGKDSNAKDEDEEELIYKLMERGANFNAQGRDGTTPLHCASIHGNDWAVTALIEAGANVDVPDFSGTTPFLWAVYQGQMGIAQTLWEASNARLRDNNGRTALHLAALSGETAIAEWLMEESRIDKEVRDRKGRRPIHWAAINGHKGTAAMLINNGAKADVKDSDGRTPLHYAARHGSQKLIMLLIGHGTAPDARDSFDWRPLDYAAVEGHEEAAETLINHGAKADMESKDWTPLHRAACEGHEKVVELLIRRGASMGAEGQTKETPLHTAAYFGRTEVVKRLLQLGAQKNPENHRGETPLRQAIQKGHKKVVKLLLEEGFDIEPQDRSERSPAEQDRLSPLYWAAMYGRANISRMLMARMADTDALNDTESSPLSLAIGFGHLEVAKVFIKSGWNVDERLSDGMTLLHKAVACGKVDLVKLLIDNGVDQKIENDQGETALQTAFEIRKEITEGIGAKTVRRRHRWTDLTVKEMDDVISLLKQ